LFFFIQIDNTNAFECKQTEAAKTKHNISELLYQSLGPNVSAIKQTLNFIKKLKLKVYCKRVIQNKIICKINHCVSIFTVSL